MRRLTILGPVKRVLPARVAHYDRKWSLRTSPSALLKKKPQKRKVQFGWQRDHEFRYLCVPFSSHRLSHTVPPKIRSNAIPRVDINCQGSKDIIQPLQAIHTPTIVEGTFGTGRRSAPESKLLSNSLITVPEAALVPPCYPLFLRLSLSLQSIRSCVVVICCAWTSWVAWWKLGIHEGGRLGFWKELLSYALNPQSSIFNLKSCLLGSGTCKLSLISS